MKPEVVIEYANRINPPDDPGSESIQSIKKTVAFENRFRIEEYPDGTLCELLTWLESVRAECDYFEEDDLIADHVDDLSEEAQDYFSSWGDLSEVDDDEPTTFSHRRDNLDEDIQSVEELYDSLGGDIVVTELNPVCESTEVA